MFNLVETNYKKKTMSQELKKLFWFVFFFLALFPTLMIIVFLYYSISSFLSYLIWAYIFLICGMILFLVPGIMLISSYITRGSIFHQKVSEKCLIPNEFYDLLLVENSLEPFQINFFEMYLNYLILTIPLYFTFIYLLNPSNYISGLDNNINNAFLASLAIIPVFLLSMRLLTNPMKADLIYLKLIKNFYLNADSVSLLKERIISFYFGLTATTYFIMLISWIYRSFSLSTDIFLFYTTQIELFKKSFIPQFDSLKIFLIICVYFIVLFLLTGMLEMILGKFEPLNDE
jgi:hypothetical protein